MTRTVVAILLGTFIGGLVIGLIAFDTPMGAVLFAVACVVGSWAGLVTRKFLDRRKRR